MAVTGTPAFVLGTEERHGIRYVTARAVVMSEDGTAGTSLFCSTDKLTELADFHVRGYASSENRHIWGWAHGYYDVYSVDVDRAEAMTRVLRRVKRGVDQMNRDAGYLAIGDGGFVLYVARVAACLKVRSLYVQNSDEVRRTTGVRRRKVDATEAQYWASDIEARYGKRG